MEEKGRDLTGTPPLSASRTESPPSEQPTSRRRGGGQKRKLASINSGGCGSSAPQTSSSKRQTREKPPAVPFPPIHMNGRLTRARLQPYSTNSLAEVAPVKSEGEAREAAAKAEEMNKLTENWEALEAKIEAEYEAIKSRDAKAHVVPFHAGWFSWTKIHPLEARMLPSFFNGKSESRTPELYMEIRNWIMKKFHLNPLEQIELKHMSELRVGKLDSQQEIMEFLEYWGLINYHPLPHQEPADAMIVDPDADKVEVGKMDSLVEKLFQFETVESWTPVTPKINTITPAMLPGLSPESVIADELMKSEGPAVEYHCNSCSTDCSRKRYHCQKQADFDLCVDCFDNGKVDSNMSPSDFILMEPAEAGSASGGKWTDQETLLLLEAIEIFRDNWSEIAEHVATKTKAQCILHFVQMPIEDAFFNHRDVDSDAPQENEVLVSNTINENSAPKDDQESDTAVKDVHENTEIQRCNTDIPDSSCPEISKQDEVRELDNVAECFALKALKEAFEATGSFPLSEDKLSFAEAGNPVMTLAAFLVRLVEPNTTNASVRSVLKFLSSNCSSEQLAARHCFPLEDPPDHKKNLADSDGPETESKIPKNEVQHTEEQETPDSNSISLHDDENERNEASVHEGHDEKKIGSSIDHKPTASPSSDHADGSETVKDSDEMATHEQAQPASESQPSISGFPKALHAPKDDVKDSENGASAGEATHSEDPLKDVDMISLTENETHISVISTPTTEKENIDGREANENASGKKEPVATNNDFDVNDKLKRAAVTAISAAAVKAKFLADQEEDEILQLSTFLIEKQLYKLETKLAFFNDMENVVMRVKELLERSKQKLFQERAQIIATRFGMAVPSRPATQILPPNRAAVNLASRPMMVMNTLRPPISRPMMSANPTSSTFSSTGSSMQPNADRLSSVGMK